MVKIQKTKCPLEVSALLWCVESCNGVLDPRQDIPTLEDETNMSPATNHPVTQSHNPAGIFRRMMEIRRTQLY
jgi:hypothetical protein